MAQSRGAISRLSKIFRGIYLRAPPLALLEGAHDRAMHVAHSVKLRSSSIVGTARIFYARCEGWEKILLAVADAVDRTSFRDAHTGISARFAVYLMFFGA